MPSTHQYNPENCATGGPCGEAPDHPIHHQNPIDVIAQQPGIGEIELVPNYPNVAKGMADAIIHQTVEKGHEAEFLLSFIDVMRYLAQKAMNGDEGHDQVVQYLEAQTERALRPV